MDIKDIQDTFSATVAKSIELYPEGVDRYQVFTPFHFDDGDHFVIALRKNGSDQWIISDEGHTYMHMSYDTDLATLKQGQRNEIIENTLDKYGIEEKDGQIFVRIDDVANAGNIFYNFIQCLINITDVSYLKRERVVSTFMEDFKEFMRKTVKPDRIQFDYRDEAHDSDSKYLVDCRINGMARPLHVYGIGNNDKCRDTTIGILNFRQWDTPFTSLGIFDNQEDINRKVLARFTDVCDRQFSSLSTNQDRIGVYLQEQIG